MSYGHGRREGWQPGCPVSAGAGVPGGREAGLQDCVGLNEKARRDRVRSVFAARNQLTNTLLGLREGGSRSNNSRSLLHMRSLPRTPRITRNITMSDEIDLEKLGNALDQGLLIHNLHRVQLSILAELVFALAKRQGLEEIDGKRLVDWFKSEQDSRLERILIEEENHDPERAAALQRLADESAERVRRENDTTPPSG